MGFFFWRKKKNVAFKKILTFIHSMSMQCSSKKLYDFSITDDTKNRTIIEKSRHWDESNCFIYFTHLVSLKLILGVNWTTQPTVATHDNKIENKISTQNFIEWKTMWKCVNPSSAAVHLLLQHSERIHSWARTHATHSCGWHFSPFSSANLLVSMVSRITISHRKSRRSVFRWWETRRLLYAHETDFQFSLRTIRMPQHVRAKFAFLRMCAYCRQWWLCSICIVAPLDLVCVFDDAFNFHQFQWFAQWLQRFYFSPPLWTVASFWLQIFPLKRKQLLMNSCVGQLIDLPRKRIDDFSTEFTASKLFCISMKFCFRIWYELAKSSLSLFKFV